MAKDLYFGTTKTNWARGVLSTPTASRPNLTLTDAEKSRLEKLAIVKMRSEAGDKKEQAHWKKLRGDVAKLVVRARRGDKKAARLVAVLEESGLFGQYQQVFAMRGEEQRFPNPYGDQTAKPLPRKPNPFLRERLGGATEILGAFVGDDAEDRAVAGIVEIYNRAVNGDTKAKSILDAVASSAQQGNARAMKLMRVITKAQSESRAQGNIEILGAFVGDEARARSEECGAVPFFGRLARRARRQRKLARLRSRAAAGDVLAQERLRRIQARLSQQPYADPTLAANQLASNPAFAYPPAAAAPTAYAATPAGPYAGLPPLPPDEEYVQDVYV